MMSSHFGSTGEYYSFRNKGTFGIVDDLSVGQYYCKKYKSTVSSSKAIINASIMEEMSVMEIELGMDGLNASIPNLMQYIAPMLNVAYAIQGFVVGLNIAKVPLSDYGLWKTSISINA